jgi:hypothetical protein
MTDNIFSPVGTMDHEVVDLTEMNVAYSPDVFPLLEHPRQPLAFMAQESVGASHTNVARRRTTNEIVDLIDDNDSVEIMPRGLCIPSTRRARKIYKTDPNESTRPNDNTILDVVETKTVAPPRPEIQVLEVFPDADVSSIQALLRDLGGNVAAVMEFMSENKYTKAEGGSHALSSTAVALSLAIESEQEWMYDYTSADSFSPSYQYRKEVMDLLLSKFPLSKVGALACCEQFKHRYTLCHNFLFEIIKGKGDDDAQYSRVLTFSKRKPLLPDQKKCIEDAFPNRGNSTIKVPRKDKPVFISDKVLQNEISYVDQKIQEWMQAQRMRQDRELKKFVSQRNGTAVECSCCFDSFPLDDMASCRNEGHLFCLQCVKSFTENLIYGSGNLGVDKRSKKLAIELQCFHGDGCISGFSREFLIKALPPKAIKKYDEVQFEVSIKLAGLQSNICSCPKCHYQADVPEGQKLFECPVATCRFMSCRNCGEAAHIPLRYDTLLAFIPFNTFERVLTL